MQQNLGLLIARVLLALMFVLSGWGKISGYAGTQGYMQSAGVPGALLPLVILAELGGGLAILFGFMTRTAAVALALFTLAAGFLFHLHAGDQMQMIMFMKNLAIAGGFFALAVAGAGAFSIDARLGKNW
nr:DoxX family protein [uncultured Roseateles sp.]